MDLYPIESRCMRGVCGVIDIITGSLKTTSTVSSGTVADLSPRRFHYQPYHPRNNIPAKDSTTLVTPV